MRNTTRNLKNRRRMQKIRSTLAQRAKQQKKAEKARHRLGCRAMSWRAEACGRARALGDIAQPGGHTFVMSD